MVRKIVAGKQDRILGEYIVGLDAENLIHEIVLAMQKGIPVGSLSAMIHVYPTLSQVNQRADGRKQPKGLPTKPALPVVFEVVAGEAGDRGVEGASQFRERL